MLQSQANLFKEALIRNIIVLTFLSLDGVMQAPGGPEEDTESGFALGGWTVPYFDETLGETMGQQIGQPFDLLLGRKTFDIFAAYWPQHDDEGKAINDATKYVASNTLTSHEWQKSVFLSGDVAAEIKKIQQTEGPDLQVHGSAMLLQTLLQNDLVDELWLKIIPVILGKGKRLFEGGAVPGAWTLTESKTTPTGVIVANYKRAGDVETGSF